MLQTKQLQSSNAVSNNWSRRLFNQSMGLYKHISLNTKSTSSANSGLLLGYKRRNLHWSKYLFASAANGLKSYDKLVVIRDRKILCEYEFRSKHAEITIGSNGIADVVLEGSKVDQFHAKVSCINGQYQFEDLGSKKGSYLNGKKVSPNESMALQNGALVHIMAFQIRFELGVEQAETTAAFDKLETRHELRPDSVLIKSDQGRICPVSSNLIVEPQATQPWCKGASELIITDIIDETQDVKTLRLVGVTPLSFSYLPGQFVTLILNIDGKEVRRSYSMSSTPSRPHTLDLTIKRVPGGLVSNWLCDHVKAGDKLKIKGPAGRFSCLHKPSKKLLFIGAGSGITPLMSMSRWLFDTASSVDAKVLFSFRHREDVIFRKELEMMADSAKAIDIAVTLTGEYGNRKNGRGFSGRIDSAMLESFARDINDRDVFLCGPEAFMNELKRMLKEMNYPLQRLHCESFMKAQSQPKAQPKKLKISKEGPHYTITFAKSNKVVQTDEHTNLLQLAEAEGIEIDYNCRTGSCAECMIKCLSGQAEMNDNCEIDDHERDQGWIFSCCAFAHSDLVIDA